MVLQRGGDDDRVGGGAQRAGEHVDRLRGVLAEHHDIALGVGTDELADAGARLFVGLGAQPGLVAGPAVHARVVGEETLDGVGHEAERRRARGIVEVHVRREAAEHGHELVDTDDGAPQVEVGKILEVQHGVLLRQKLTVEECADRALATR